MSGRLSTYALVIVTPLLLATAGCLESERGDNAAPDEARILEPSLVYLDVTAYSYEPFQPWKQPDLAQWTGYGAAVGPYQVLTTAWNVRDAAFVKVRRHGQNAFITAEIDVVDYESNLCLLSLDPNSAGAPLVPLTFSDNYEEGADVTAYWLSGAGQVQTARGQLDRAEVQNSTVSYTRSLQLIAKETGKDSGRGRLFMVGGEPVGLACWADNNTGETGLIPGETILAFLADAADGEYAGFAAEGFEAQVLRDPVLRRYLEMPDDLTDGIYVSKVYTLGTGAEKLKPGDVLLAINDQPIDAGGQFAHPVYRQLTYHYLLTRLHAGDPVRLSVWRDGRRMEMETQARNFSADEMLVPFYEHGYAPQYIITAGYVFQKLTRPYLTMWGDDWTGQVPPHLYQYYRNSMFSPTDERQDIVLLSRILPHPVNIGYHGLGMMVVKTINGRPIRSLADVQEVLQQSNPTGLDVVEFEEHRPTVVIPRDRLSEVNAQIAQIYGVDSLQRILE